MKRLNVIQVECNTCGYTYNSLEYNECPVCEKMHILSKDFLVTTDDDIESEQYIT
jgi:predicted Zn-ribbon and HTH transcriptional regulator